ncbi:hypothetical protein ACVIEM_005644 [Rhizobium leguminosarum]
MAQDLAEKGSAAVGFRVGKEFIRRAALDDGAGMQDHALRDLAGKGRRALPISSRGRAPRLARDGHLLLLAAGQLRGVGIDLVREADLGEQLAAFQP